MIRMKREEANKLFLEGKKLRNTMDEALYYYFDFTELCLRDSCETRVDTGLYESGWEVYEEKKTLSDNKWTLTQGKTILKDETVYGEDYVKEFLEELQEYINELNDDEEYPCKVCMINKKIEELAGDKLR